LEKAAKVPVVMVLNHGQVQRDTISPLVDPTSHRGGDPKCGKATFLLRKPMASGRPKEDMEREAMEAVTDNSTADSKATAGKAAITRKGKITPLLTTHSIIKTNTLSRPVHQRTDSLTIFALTSFRLDSLFTNSLPDAISLLIFFQLFQLLITGTYERLTLPLGR